MDMALYNERKETADKLKRLLNEVLSESMDTIPKQERDMYESQFYTLMNYHKILAERARLYKQMERDGYIV